MKDLHKSYSHFWTPSVPATSFSIIKISCFVDRVRLVFDGRTDAFFSSIRLLDTGGRLVAGMTQPKASRMKRRLRFNWSIS